MRKTTTRCILTLLTLIYFVIPILGQGRFATAQEALKSPAGSSSPATSKPASQHRRIIILGTTIVGSVVRPRVVYEVPWKEPDSLKKGLDEPQRDFHQEIFTLIDKEQFESEMEKSR